MKKLGDEIKRDCKKCKDGQTFKVIEISEYGEVFGVCDKCKKIIRL